MFEQTSQTNPDLSLKWSTINFASNPNKEIIHHLFDIYLTFIWHSFDIYLTFISHSFNIYLIFFCCLFYIYWILFSVQRVAAKGHRFKSCFLISYRSKSHFYALSNGTVCHIWSKSFFYWKSLKRFFINMWSFHPIFD